MNCQSDEKRMREVEQEWYAMQGFKTDIKCHFYYDESNNCRKFWVRTNQKNSEKEFNVNPYEDFVLAGVVAKQELDVSFEELARLLKLQKNVTEIKFKNQFSKGISVSAYTTTFYIISHFSQKFNISRKFQTFVKKYFLPLSAKAKKKSSCETVSTGASCFIS